MMGGRPTSSMEFPSRHEHVWRHVCGVFFYIPLQRVLLEAVAFECIIQRRRPLAARDRRMNGRKCAKEKYIM